jgi:hypothetical protein
MISFWSCMVICSGDMRVRTVRAWEHNLSDRDEQFTALAKQFSDYLHGQTGIALEPPVAGEPASLRQSIERLDLALAQIADLASVYGADHRSDIEPLTVPTAVLTGEYLRIGIGAHWLEPAFDGDGSLLLVTPDGVAIDLDGLARSALLSQQPNLSALVERLILP